MTCSSMRSNPLRVIVAFQCPKKKLTVGGFYAILVDIARRASLTAPQAMVKVGQLYPVDASRGIRCVGDLCPQPHGYSCPLDLHGRVCSRGLPRGDYRGHGGGLCRGLSGGRLRNLALLAALRKVEIPEAPRGPIKFGADPLSRYVRHREAADLRQRRFVTPCGMLLFSLNHPTQYAQRRARSWTVVMISAPERQLENARSVMYWLSANASSGYG